MRENRTYGSEGGEPGDRASLPLSPYLEFETEPGLRGESRIGMSLMLV